MKVPGVDIKSVQPIRISMFSTLLLNEQIVKYNELNKEVEIYVK